MKGIEEKYIEDIPTGTIVKKAFIFLLLPFKYIVF